MARLDTGLLLEGLQHQIRSALSEAVHEHIEENVDVNALFQTFMKEVLKRCGKSQHISDSLVHKD